MKIFFLTTAPARLLLLLLTMTTLSHDPPPPQTHTHTHTHQLTGNHVYIGHDVMHLKWLSLHGGTRVQKLWVFIHRKQSKLFLGWSPPIVAAFSMCTSLWRRYILCFCQRLLRTVTMSSSNGHDVFVSRLLTFWVGALCILLLLQSWSTRFIAL